MQIIDNIKQGTPEWDDLRRCIITASKIEVLSVAGKCKETGFGAGALTYMNELMGERITGLTDKSWGGNGHTERGNDLEPFVVDLYADRAEVTVRHVGIILNQGCGYSPDGLCNETGAVEIKTKKAALQCKVILDGVVPYEHYHQCMSGLWLSEREWIDFVSYSPGMPLFIKRLHRDEEQIRKYAAQVEKFYWHMEKRMQKILNVDLGIAA